MPAHKAKQLISEMLEANNEIGLKIVSAQENMQKMKWVIDHATKMMDALDRDHKGAVKVDGKLYKQEDALDALHDMFTDIKIYADNALNYINKE